MIPRFGDAPQTLFAAHAVRRDDQKTLLPVSSACRQSNTCGLRIPTTARHSLRPQRPPNLAPQTPPVTLRQFLRSQRKTAKSAVQSGQPIWVVRGGEAFNKVSRCVCSFDGAHLVRLYFVNTINYAHMGRTKAQAEHQESRP